MGVQIAAAMGAEVAVISQTRAKEADGLRFGATEYHALAEPDALKKLRGSFDLIISTLSTSADVTPYIQCLRTGATYVNVGLPQHPVTLAINALCSGNKILTGSNIGGIPETQEMLDFCAAHGFGAQVEVISGEEINAAYDKVVNSQVRYRYVIDTSTFPPA
ncbi:MAG: zinc-binding dehydrogenase, partial [Actinomycetia bacterium]|nr:zinc-binding dehydrogenase [Actinomycetes bacterium]